MLARTLLATLFIGALAAGAAAPAARPGKRTPAEVAALIDRAVEAKLATLKMRAGPAADDAEFLRRAYLDLTGRIPSAGAARAFLASKELGKRAKLIDELLDGPEFAQNFARQWARLLTAEEPPRRPALEKWLAVQFREGRPWGETVSEMLTATGMGPQTGFVMSNVENRQPQPNKLAGSAARLFLGVQLQCAECHKHPFADYDQDDFWGVAAFFGRTRVQAKKEPKGVAEIYVPVRGKGKKGAVTGAAIALPATAGKGAGRVVTAKFLGGGRPALDGKEAFRPALAAWLTARENRLFARAAANRVWGQLFGRGLVNPVDDMHEGNPATHPEVLQTLADEFAASGHDFKHLLRCVCNSKAYQRTSRGGDAEGVPQEAYARMTVKVMSPDALYDSLCQALGVKELRVAQAAGTSSGRGGKRGAARETARDRFLKAFNTADPETTPAEYTHGIPQALSLLNEPQLNAASPLLAGLGGKAPGEAVEGMFLALLARRPTEAERKRLLAYLEKRPGARGRAGVLWALLNSPEFVLVP